MPCPFIPHLEYDLPPGIGGVLFVFVFIRELLTFTNRVSDTNDIS